MEQIFWCIPSQVISLFSPPFCFDLGHTWHYPGLLPAQYPRDHVMQKWTSDSSLWAIGLTNLVLSKWNPSHLFTPNLPFLPSTPSFFTSDDLSPAINFQVFVWLKRFFFNSFFVFSPPSWCPGIISGSAQGTICGVGIYMRSAVYQASALTL